MSDPDVLRLEGFGRDGVRVCGASLNLMTGKWEVRLWPTSAPVLCNDVADARSLLRCAGAVVIKESDGVQ